MAPALLRSVCRASCSPAGGSRLGPADLPNSRARWPRRCAAGPGHSANFPAFIFIDTGLGSVRAIRGVTWRRFVPGRRLPDRATPLPPPSTAPLRRQELTGAWRVVETAGRPSPVLGRLSRA